MGIRAARLATHEPANAKAAINDAIDLYDFTEKLDASPNIDPPDLAANPTIRTAITNAVIAEQHGANQASTHGINIYFPRIETNNGYVPFSFDAGSYFGTLYAPNPQWRPPAPPGGPPGGQNAPGKSVPRNDPRPPEPEFTFPAKTGWGNFLFRYYRPVADAGGPYNGVAGQVVPLKGGGSSDADGTLSNLLWDFNTAAGTGTTDADKDGIPKAEDDVDAQGANVNFPCPAAGGVFNIRLVVRDNYETTPGGSHASHFNVHDEKTTVTCTVAGGGGGGGRGGWFVASDDEHGGSLVVLVPLAALGIAIAAIRQRRE